MDELDLFCCQNSDCADYGLRRKGNLRICFHYGPGKQRRMLACRTCQSRFSERKGTALFDSRLPHEQARFHDADRSGVIGPEMPFWQDLLRSFGFFMEPAVMPNATRSNPVMWC